MDAKQKAQVLKHTRVLVTYETGVPLYVADYGVDEVEITNNRATAYTFPELIPGPGFAERVQRLTGLQGFHYSGILLEEPTVNP